MIHKYAYSAAATASVATATAATPTACSNSFTGWNRNAYPIEYSRECERFDVIQSSSMASKSAATTISATTNNYPIEYSREFERFDVVCVPRPLQNSADIRPDDINHLRDKESRNHRYRVHHNSPFNTPMNRQPVLHISALAGIPESGRPVGHPGNR